MLTDRRRSLPDRVTSELERNEIDRNVEVVGLAFVGGEVGEMDDLADLAGVGIASRDGVGTDGNEWDVSDSPGGCFRDLDVGKCGSAEVGGGSDGCGMVAAIAGLEPKL